MDPESPSVEEQETSLQLPEGVYPTVPTEFPVSARSWSEAVQGRIISSESYTQTHGAENGDLPFILFIADSYTPVQGVRVASGGMAYHLPNPDRTPQILIFDEEMLIKGTSPSLEFDSSLAWATESQYASVDISLGTGDNWTSIWSQHGLVEQNGTFTPVSIDLTPWIGRSVRFRFRYDFEQISGFWFDDPNTGWAFDNIRFTETDSIVQSTELPVMVDNSLIETTFESTDLYQLQAKEFVFDGMGTDWGPVLEVQPSPYTEISAPLDTWVEDPVMGWISGAESGWIFSLVMGWIHTESFPWIWADKGWFYYLRGSARSTLWLYSSNFSYAYTNDSLGGWFNHEPYGPDDWKTFRN